MRVVDRRGQRAEQVLHRVHQDADQLTQAYTWFKPIIERVQSKEAFRASSFCFVLRSIESVTGLKRGKGRRVVLFLILRRSAP
jgi:hypothetical protein